MSTTLTLPASAGGGTVRGGAGKSPFSTGMGLQDSRPSTEKRTFKEKLHEAILQAEGAELEAARKAAKQDKKALAVSLLVDGHPAAFADFFTLTHTPPGGGAEQSAVAPPAAAARVSAPPQKAAPHGSSSEGLPQQILLLLRAQLVRADAAQRRGDVQEVCEAYTQLAKSFAQLGRLRISEFFFQKCLHLSQSAGWLSGELEANLALGIVYEELQDVGLAVACHERRLELASESGAEEVVTNACQSLAQVYLRQAEALDASKDADAALDAYNRCLNAADRGGDAEASSKAHYQMGMLYHQHDKWTDAMFYLRRFIDLCGTGRVQGVDRAAEGAAHTTYAHCLQEVGDAAAAISSLEAYLGSMPNGEDQSGPAIACCSLGVLYYNQGVFETCVSYFQRFFEIARGLGNGPMLEAARFNLGVARGAVLMQSYMSVVHADLPKLIAWRNARVPFATPQPR